MCLLFSSVHCYLDPSSGADLCTRELLELLAGRGVDCRLLTTGILDPERETSLDEVLAALELPNQRFQAELGMGRAAEVIDLSVNGGRVTLMPTASSRAERSPDPRESAIFLELAEQVFDRFRPDALLTYGGHPASLELMRRAQQRRIAVVFHLHTFGQSEPKGSDSKKRSRGLCRRLGRDLPVGILPSPPCPAAGPGRSGHPRPDPVRPHRRGGPRAEIRHVHPGRRHRVAQPPRFARWCTPRRSATSRNRPQPGSAGGEETAQQPACGQLPQPRLPVLGVAAQPLEDPGQLTGDHGFALAEQPPGVSTSST